MRIAHFSDTHLGYRAYGRTAPNGLNQREVDVFKTFERFLDSIMERDPDVILHTGDFFHTVRPSNHTIVNAFRRISSAQEARSARPFVILAGNHETPRSVEAGCILRLFGNPEGRGSIPGVHTIVDEITALNIGIDLELLAVPSRGIEQRKEYDLRPRAGKSVAVLAAHGLDAGLRLSSADFELDELHPDKWDYVALGDYHVRKELRANAAYCGSTDFTSTNIWEEASHPKGWHLFDSEKGGFEFIEVRPVRGVIDLPAIDAAGLSGAETGERMLAAATWDAEELPVVRQRLANVHPVARAEIPGDFLRELKARTVYYRLDIEVARPAVSEAGRGGQARPLEDEWREFAAGRELPKVIER
ncbi:MAG: metallophosphoesterase, partial [Armatimonadetes bacterium]|nr:metallophosphoesterase [Armatimonadota bacterium]